MKKQNPRITLRGVAGAAGVSRATVCLVLRNRVGPSPQTRKKVLAIAKRLGYVPDARLTSVMSQVRDTTSKDFLPIAWLNTNFEKDAWNRYTFLRPYHEGVRDRCSELGYRLEEIWTHQPGMTMRRISKILRQRGIEGVIITPPAFHFRLDWNILAGVTIGSELLAPRLHRVKSDAIFNLQLALKLLRRFGYKRIGVCLSKVVDRSTNHLASSYVQRLASTSGKSTLVEPLFYSVEYFGHAPPKEEMMTWVEAKKPQVIVCQDNRLLPWLKSAGYRVPQDIELVHLAVDDDVLDWAGIIANKREQGRAAAELVISLVQNRQFGVPKTAMDTVIRGSWKFGNTMLPRKL